MKKLQKKKFKLRKREYAVIIAALLITVAGIQASDKLLNFKNKNLADSGPCPDGMVYVNTAQGGFCIDKYEVSAGPDCQNKNPSNQNESRVNLTNQNCVPVSVSGANPWVNISENQAELACARAGKRLPENEEWSKAALGTPDNESGWNSDDCQVNSNWNGQPGTTGSGKNCVSSAGAYDMIGNVWEWVGGMIVEGMYKGRKLPEQGYVLSVDEIGMAVETNPVNPDNNHFNDYIWLKSQGTRSIARGGYWDNQEKAGQYSAYLVSDPSFAGIGVGFRCVK
jgi:formylglycine-generating enzyme required for sulfatase activity